MRAVVQRVRRAEVAVGDEVVGRIAVGWLVLLGVAPNDAQKEVEWLADKVANRDGTDQGTALRADPDSAAAIA